MRIATPPTLPFHEITAANAEAIDKARLREVLPNLRREAARGDQRAARIVQHVVTRSAGRVHRAPPWSSRW